MIDIPSGIDQAIEVAGERIGSRAIAVVAEHPAHLPAVSGDMQGFVGVVAGMVVAAAGLVRRGEVRVRAAMLPAGEPVGEGGPWVQIQVQGSEGGELFPTGPSREAAGPESAPAAEASGLPGPDDWERFADQHGGRLRSEQAPGPHPAMILTLPIQSAPDAAPDMSSLREALAARLPSRNRTPHTLLLVIDHPEYGELLVRDLSAAGYGVMLSNNGRDGVAIARETTPNLILLDLMIRQPNAFDSALILRQDTRTRGIPVLFVTLDRDEQGELSARAVNFLVRPAGTGALVAALNSMLTSGVSPSSRVLVVEPDAALRDTIVMMIQAHGFRVTEATGAEEALAFAERMPLGLILVNAGLAQERDFWLLRGLRHASADAGIYVLADGLSEAMGKAAVRRGASGYSDTGKLPDLLDRVSGQNGTRQP